MAKHRKIGIAAVICFFLISIPIGVLAANASLSYLAADKIFDGNYIKAAATIDLAGAINGDVIVAGNTITIAGPVAGDVIAAGQTVIIKGPVSGSIRVVAGSLEIDSSVEHNVWFFAKNVTVNDAAEIGWDVYGSASAVTIKSKVNGAITVNASSITIGNAVGKNADITLDNGGRLVLLPEAKIAGNLTYQAGADSQLAKQNGAVVGGQTQRRATNNSALDWRGWASYIFFLLVNFFSLLVVGLVLITLLPKLVFKIKEEMTSRPWPNIWRGIGYIIIVPILAVILMVTIIGFPLGLILMPLYLIALYLAKVFAAFTIGLFLVNYFTKLKKYGGSLIWPLALGLALVIILGAIPILGGLIKLILIFWSFGAMIVVKKEIGKEFR